MSKLKLIDYIKLVLIVLSVITLIEARNIYWVFVTMYWVVNFISGVVKK